VDDAVDVLSLRHSAPQPETTDKRVDEPILICGKVCFSVEWKAGCVWCRYDNYTFGTTHLVAATLIGLRNVWGSKWGVARSAYIILRAMSKVNGGGSFSARELKFRMCDDVHHLTQWARYGGRSKTVEPLTTPACCLPAGCREEATAGIVFTQRLKINIFVLQGRLVAPILVKFGIERVRSSAWLCKISPQSVQGWERGSRNIKKNPLFREDSSCVGKQIDGFPNVLGAFMRTTTQHKYFKFGVIRFRGYGVIAEKPRAGNLPRIFLCNL